MTKESKLQIERRVVEILGVLNGKYYSLNRVEEPEISFLKSIGISLERDPEHDAAGINDDWPIGRGVYIQEEKNMVALVNFEDHVQFFVLPDGKDNFKEGLKRALKLLHTFEKLGFAVDPYLGNLTASPKHLGTALRLEANLRFENKLDHKIDEELQQELEYGKALFLKNRLDTGEKDVVIETGQTLAPNYNENI